MIEKGEREKAAIMKRINAMQNKNADIERQLAMQKKVNDDLDAEFEVEAAEVEEAEKELLMREYALTEDTNTEEGDDKDMMNSYEDDDDMYNEEERAMLELLKSMADQGAGEGQGNSDLEGYGHRVAVGGSTNDNDDDEDDDVEAIRTTRERYQSSSSGSDHVSPSSIKSGRALPPLSKDEITKSQQDLILLSESMEEKLVLSSSRLKLDPLDNTKVGARSSPKTHKEKSSRSTPTKGKGKAATR
jgi:hypothetical protein